MRYVIYFLGVLGLLFIILFFGYRSLEKWGETLQEVPLAVVVELKPAASLSVFSRRLARKGIVNDEHLFQLWVRIFSDYSKFQAGKYRFDGVISPKQISEQARAGKVYRPVVLEVTLPEGFTLSQSIKRFAAKGVGTIRELTELSRKKEFLRSLKVTSESLEGYLYPATYRFSKMPSPEEVFREAVEVFWKRLPVAYEENVRKLGLTLNEAVTFASLIEMETPYDEERRYVAEVIWNRLKRNMPLAIDASIIYGIEDYKGNLSRRHLNDRSNKYNTRVHRGLPPTPICSPSVSSLESVLNPSNEGYFYYVLDLGNKSRHHFSKTLREHNRYVRKLIQDSRKRRRERKG